MSNPLVNVSEVHLTDVPLVAVSLKAGLLKGRGGERCSESLEGLDHWKAFTECISLLLLQSC